MLDRYPHGITAVAAVNGRERGAADQFPGVNDAAAGEKAVEQEAAPLGVQLPGDRDEVSHVARGRDGGGLSVLHGARGLGGQRARVYQLQHAAQPRDVLLAVTAVVARLGVVRVKAVAAVPGTQRRF